MKNKNDSPKKKKKSEFNIKNEVPVKIYQIPEKNVSSSEELSSDKNIETDDERNSSNNNTPSHKTILEKTMLENVKQKTLKPTKKYSNNISIKDIKIKKKI
jgi:hypothetical protein